MFFVFCVHSTMHEYVGISHIKSKTDDQKRDSVVTRIQNSPFAKIYKLLLPRARVDPKFFRRPWINPDNLPPNPPKGILVFTNTLAYLINVSTFYMHVYNFLGFFLACTLL